MALQAQATLERTAANKALEDGKAAIAAAAEVEKAGVTAAAELQKTALTDAAEAEKAAATAKAELAKTSSTAAAEAQKAGITTAADLEKAGDIAAAEAEKATTTAERELKRLNYTASRELHKEHLEAHLAQLQTYLAKHPEEYKKVQKKLMKMFKTEFGPQFKTAGANLGLAFATGMAQSFRALQNAAHQFATILERYLRLHSPAKTGPLSSLNTWWTALHDTLLSGVDMSKTGAYIAGGVDASLSAAPRSFGGGTGASGGGNTYVTINVPVSNAWGDDPKAVALKVRNHLVELVRSGQIPNVGLA